MTTKYDAQSVVRRLHQVGYSLEQTDQTPKLTQLMKDSITLIEQMYADVRALAEALNEVTSDLHIQVSAKHGPEATARHPSLIAARAALKRIQGEGK